MREKKGIGGFLSDLIFDGESQTAQPTHQPNNNNNNNTSQQVSTPTQTVTHTATPTQTLTATQTVTQTATTTAAPLQQGGINNEMHESLVKLIEDNNIEGFDYLEFMDSVQKMSTVNLPENEKYKLVYGTAQSFGVTVDKLIEAVDHYVSILEKHKVDFQSHVEAQVSNEVGSRKSKIESLEKETEELNAQIAEISKKIADNTTEISTLTQETSQQELKINMVQHDFNHTFEHVLNRMISDKEKIRSYLSA